MQALPQAQLCLHCGETVPEMRSTAFCCLGCETVYTFIQTKGLGQYYKIRERLNGARRPAKLLTEDFTYLDEPDFQSAYSQPSESGSEMRFYLEGVHCSACVWVVENLASALPGIEQIRLDLGNHVATVNSSTGKFAEVAQEISKLGYRPHPVREGAEEKLLRAENRKLLARMAVAGTCAGNIMLLAISLYSGLSGTMAVWFDWISAVLFLPVLFYSATPLLGGAWNSLKQKNVSIDVPVALGIILGSFTSYLNLLQGRHELYFDSLSALVFLLLSSRYLLRRAHQVSLHQSHLLNFITPSSARRKRESGYDLVRVDSLHPGDQVEVRVGETIPCDGCVLQGNASMDMTLLTGESFPQLVSPGDTVYAGTVNRSGNLVIGVKSLGYETRLGLILRATETHLKKKAPILSFSDRIAKNFTLGLLLLVAGVFLLRLHSGWHSALSDALALSIVACPCAFALAAPLAMSRVIGKLARAGILVKGSESLEKLAQVRDVFFDKTGTLTQGELQVRSWLFFESNAASRNIQRAVASLEELSNHPAARAIVSHLRKTGKKAEPEKVTGFVETLGKGVSGTFEGAFYEIQGDPSSGEILIKRDGLVAAKAGLSDSVRKDSDQAIKELSRLGLNLFILSGDHESKVKDVARELDIPDSHVYSQVSPEKKAELLSQHPRAMMVGDGANDAAALASAFVGVAVHNGAEISLRASDIYSCIPGVSAVVQLVIAGRESLRVIHRNFAISLIYNLIAAAGAAAGKINPLLAAVLMPMSALTVFISSIIGTRRLQTFVGKEWAS